MVRGMVLAAVALLMASASADAGLFSRRSECGGCGAPAPVVVAGCGSTSCDSCCTTRRVKVRKVKHNRCCAPAQSCCAPAAPVCAAPAPTCCAPAPTCCAPAPAACGGCPAAPAACGGCAPAAAGAAAVAPPPPMNGALQAAPAPKVEETPAPPK